MAKVSEALVSGEVLHRMLQSRYIRLVYSFGLTVRLIVLRESEGQISQTWRKTIRLRILKIKL